MGSKFKVQGFPWDAFCAPSTYGKAGTEARPTGIFVSYGGPQTMRNWSEKFKVETSAKVSYRIAALGCPYSI
jgi:hypothetical protein